MTAGDPDDARAVTREARRQARVLVVDDESQVRAVLREALELEGHEVSEARNGAEALEVLARWRPDVLLLDLWMPVLDGWSFRAAQLDAHPGIALVVLSALSADDPRVVEMSADAVLPKPFSLDALLEVVARLAAPAQR